LRSRAARRDEPDPDGQSDDPGAERDRLADFPESVAAFRKPDSTPWRAGDRLVQHDLAGTLDRIADGGPDEFYRGTTAAMIARYMTEHGGLISHDDLDAYRAHERPPVHTTFRGFDVFSMGPSASWEIRPPCSFM